MILRKGHFTVVCFFAVFFMLVPVAAAPAMSAPTLIAHAGGAINQQTYTNSLEALNANYAKGFRFFEIDLS
jgi:glycerophosphoryl diester phosphodiesterase